MIMKKLKIWSMMMLVAIVLPIMVACGGDDGNGQDSQIEAAYDKVKSQIIGSWVYEAEYKSSIDINRDLNPMGQKIGWNERDPYKSLIFSTDGTLITDFYGETKYAYTITAEVNYKNYVKEYDEYYPFKNGGVLLQYGNFHYFVDIVNGKLILYDTYYGTPKERYRRK